MNKIVYCSLLAICMALIGSSNVEAATPEFYVGTPGTRPDGIHNLSLWYDMPATATGCSDTWMEYALPMGNGQIGATIRGGVMTDEIQFNEKTLWSGYNTNDSPVEQGFFQNFGSILVKDVSQVFSTSTADRKPIENYNRYLDIVDGVAGVNFLSPDQRTTYSRRYFTSATDHVFVARYQAKGRQRLALSISYAPDTQIHASQPQYADASATFHGKLQIVQYNTRFRVLTDGTTTTTPQGIRVDNATWMTLVMAAATDFDLTRPDGVSGISASELAATVQERVDKAARQKYKKLLASHTAAHSALMNRVDLNLDGTSSKTTDALIRFYNEGDANRTSPDGRFLETLYFQYGRYVTIGANLDTTIHAPSNLQGIWNDRSNSDFWHCDVHADINVEMNYWPADPTNLSEMHLPFLNHILDLGAPGSNSPWYRYARDVKQQSAGWTVAVENNIFGGSSTWGIGEMKTLGAWYCTHLWRYYKYTMDREFLRKALPVMYQNALFTASLATRDSQGRYEIHGELSPEHGPADVTAFGQQTTYEVLDEIMKGHAELGAESPLTAAQIAAIQPLYDNYDRGLWTEQLNGKEHLSEWKNNPLSDNEHRHLSHLMCLYPFSQVSPFAQDPQDKRLFEAAYKSMIARNGDVTGWSMGWQTNTYSRCLDGDRARLNLSLALRHSGSYDIEMANMGGCYYNLFDAHSPFQIDGNYGCTSGIAEMLLQSYDDVITPLPALPTAWRSSGSVRGLKAEGNFVVDITWQNGSATQVAVTSNAGQPLRLRLPNADTYSYRHNGKRVTPTISGNLVTLPGVKAGDKVTLTLAANK